MKSSALIFCLLMVVSFYSYAQETVPASTPVVEVVATPSPTPAPTIESQIPVVEVAEPAAPPRWAESLIVAAQELPVIGPIVSKILLYAGIVSSILTAFIAFLITTLNALRGVLNFAGLASFADKVTLFKDGRVMYWLKYLSMFNAKKPAPKV